jgi:hypothetical protein
MPERSRISPMKVKNGTASRTSFDITWKTRSGSACRSGQLSVIEFGA